MNSTIIDGNNICDNLLSSNKDDYLTSKVVVEASSIIGTLSSIESLIAGVQSAVDNKKNEIAQRKKDDTSSGVDVHIDE